MKRRSISLAAGTAALALLAGCDFSVDANQATPANQAAPPPTPAPPPARPFDPFRLKFQQVIQPLRVDANSDVEAFVMMIPVDIMLPNPGNAGPGRIYVVHARAGPVTVRAGGASIEGSSSLILQRGQSAILMSDGRDSYLRLNPI